MPSIRVLQWACGVPVLLSLGCAAAHGPVFTPAPPATEPRALIYIYRLDRGQYQSAYTPTVDIDGKDYAELPRNGYTYVYVPPGNHRVGVEHNPLSGIGYLKVTLPTQAGEVYYLSYNDQNSFGTYGGASLRALEPSKALPEIEKTRYVEPLPPHKP